MLNINKITISIFCALGFGFATRPESSDQDPLSTIKHGIVKILEMDLVRAKLIEHFSSSDLAKLREANQASNVAFELLLWPKLINDISDLEVRAKIDDNTLESRRDHLRSLPVENQLFCFRSLRTLFNDEANYFGFSTSLEAKKIILLITRFSHVTNHLKTHAEFRYCLPRIEPVYTSIYQRHSQESQDLIDMIRNDDMSELLEGAANLNTLIANRIEEMNQVAEAIDANPELLENLQCTKEVFLAPWQICIKYCRHLNKLSFFLDALQYRVDNN